MSEEKTITALKGTIVILIVFIIWLVTANSKNYYEIKQINKNTLDSLSYEMKLISDKADSLGGEIFIYETQLNRYQIALEMLENENPSAASEFNKRLSMTE